MKYTLEGEETERLKFRLLNIEDFDDCIELFKDNEVCRFLGVDKVETPNERCKLWFEMTFDRYKNDLGGQNILIEKNTNKIVGQSGLLVREIEGKQEIEIAYSILPEYRKKGFATESTEKVANRNGMRKDKTTEFKGMSVTIYRINSSEWENKKKTKSSK